MNESLKAVIESLGAMAEKILSPMQEEKERKTSR